MKTGESVAVCPEYEVGNSRVRMAVKNLLTEENSEKRIIKACILMGEIQANASCGAYKDDTALCVECRTKNFWRLRILKTSIDIDVKLSQTIWKLDGIVDSLHGTVVAQP